MSRFNKFNAKYLTQSLSAYCFTLAALVCMGHLSTMDVLGGIGVSAVAASTFLIFAIPTSEMATPRRLLGGYACGIASGVAGNYCIHMLLRYDFLVANNDLYILAGSLALFIATFTMVTFDFEHPPAAGLAVGLTLEHWDNHVLLVVGGSVVVLSLIRFLLRDHLINLL